MTPIRVIILFCAAAVLMPAHAAQTSPAEQAPAGHSPPPTEVYVYPGNPAYLLFQSVPADLSPQERERFTAQAMADGAHLVPWDQFVADLDRQLQASVLRPDYPEYDLARAILCLTRVGPGFPWGVTWNGGIALTENDYAWAEKRYRLYREKPRRYRPMQNQPADPNHPGNFLPMLGCGQ